MTEKKPIPIVEDYKEIATRLRLLEAQNDIARRLAGSPDTCRQCDNLGWERAITTRGKRTWRVCEHCFNPRGNYKPDDT